MNVLLFIQSNNINIFMFISFMFISFVKKKRTKESNPKRMLLPALPKGNIYGKRVGFKHLPANLPKCLNPRRQALLHVSVDLLSFTPTLARRFGNLPAGNFCYRIMIIFIYKLLLKLIFLFVYRNLGVV